MRRTAPDAGTRASHRSPWLSDAAEARLRAPLGSARRQATAESPVLASVTERLAGTHDPAAGVVASRAPGQPWDCLEQPARDGTAHAGLGVALALETAGADRFKVLERRWRGLSEQALADSPDAPPGVGLVAMAGFAFADDGAGS